MINSKNVLGKCREPFQDKLQPFDLSNSPVFVPFIKI